MAWNRIKASVQDAIKSNNNQEITGQVLQTTLISIINSLGSNFSCAGVANPSTNPGTPDGPVYYFAFEAGVYSNFGAIELDGTTLHLFFWDGNTWENMDTKIGADSSILNRVNESLRIIESSLFNEGEESYLPIINKSFYAKVSNLQGRIYTSTKNVAKLLALPNGSVTYNGLTLSITENYKIRVIGRPTQSGFICFNNLKWYTSANDAIEEVSMPILPDVGTYGFYINHHRGNYCKLYARTESFQWLATLTSSNDFKSGITYQELSSIGALLYYISLEEIGIEHDEEYNIALYPSILINGMTYQGLSTLEQESIIAKVVNGWQLLLENTWGDGSADIKEAIAIMPQMQERISAAESNIDKMQRAINETNPALFFDVLFNEGEELSLPILAKTGYAKFSNVVEPIYTGTANLAQLLGIARGTVTYNGITMTIDNKGKVTVSGTATSTCYISVHNLKGYTSLGDAIAETSIPRLPDFGRYRIAANPLDSQHRGNFSLYARNKANTRWIALLTQNTDVINLEYTDLADIGVLVMYISNGTTYSGEYYIGLVPTILQFPYSLLKESKVDIINTDGIYGFGEYTLSEGTPTVKRLNPMTDVYSVKGKKCAWFGDSLSELQNLPHLVGNKTTVTVYDCSFAGAPLTYSSSDYQDTGFMSLCSQIVNRNFSPCRNAINTQYATGKITEERRDAKLANLGTLESINFTEIDMIVVFAGTNDLSYSLATLDNIKNGLSNAINTILAAYPHIQIYVITPPYRTDGNEVHPNGLILSQIVSSIIDICKIYAIPYFDFYHLCGVNSVNYLQYLNSDGLHQNSVGDEMWSTRLSNWLKSII